MIEGEMVYLPQETVLTNSNLDSRITIYERLKEPKTAIMVSKLDTGSYRCKIYLNGMYWFVEERRAYPVNKK